jgi:outer membrane receptor for ferrienterochelin and colicins
LLENSVVNALLNASRGVHAALPVTREPFALGASTLNMKPTQTPFKLSLLRTMALPALALPLLALAQPAAPTARPAASPAAASASAPAAAASAVQRQDRIDVRGTNTESERRQSTASRIVVNRDELLKQGDTTISEALKRVPGVSIGGPPGRGGPIQMRGLGGGMTRIMLNGEPLPRGFDLDSLSPEVVERVEVFRAATAEHSSQAMAGAINIVTRVPVSRNSREFTLGGAYENGRFSPQIGLRMNGPAMASTGLLASVSFTLNGQVTFNNFLRPNRSSEAGFNAQGQPTLLRQTHTAFEDSPTQLNIAPRFQWNLGRGEFLALEPFLFSQRVNQTQDAATASVLGVPATFASSNYTGDFGFDSARLNLQYNRPFGEGGKLEASVGINDNKFSGRFYTDAFGRTGAKLLDRSYVVDVDSSGVTTRGKVTIPTAESHDLSTGWEMNFQRQYEVRSRKETSYSPSVIPDSLDEDYSARVRTLALYAQDEWKINKAWSLYSGARYESVLIETLTSGNPALNPSYTNQSKVLSPSLQSLYKLGDKQRDQIRVALSRTYRAPNPFQLSPRKFSSVNNGPTSPDQQGNPTLKPELAWGLDLGYEHYPATGGIMSVNLFYRDIDDVFRNVVALDSAGRWLRQPINNGKAKTVGIETEWKFNLQDFDKSWPRLDIRSNLSMYNSSVSNIPGPNNRLEQQAPVLFNLGADYNVPGLPMPLQVGGNLNVTTGGEVRTATNQTVYGSVKRGLDFYAQLRPSRTSTARVAVANVLQQDAVSITNVFDPSFGNNASTQITPTKPVIRLTWTERF